MGNLRETILDQSRWRKPEGQQLRFEEEVRGRDADSEGGAAIHT